LRAKKLALPISVSFPFRSGTIRHNGQWKIKKKTRKCTISRMSCCIFPTEVREWETVLRKLSGGKLRRQESNLRPPVSEPGERTAAPRRTETRRFGRSKGCGMPFANPRRLPIVSPTRGRIGEGIPGRLEARNEFPRAGSQTAGLRVFNVAGSSGRAWRGATRHLGTADK
jgi:hypothetical protein